MSKKHKKAAPPVPAPRLTARDWLAQQTGTQPEDWTEVTSGTKLYGLGYRYQNRTTGQKARRPTNADTVGDTVNV